MSDTGQTSSKAEAGDSRVHRRVRQGVVISDARDKTIKVRHEFSRPHPKYGKIIRRRTTMHVHDAENEARAGDTVEFMACRPISKQKSWRLIRVLKKAVD